MDEIKQGNVTQNADGSFQPYACTNAFDEETRQRLATKYLRALCDYQLQILKMHFGRTATKLSRWAVNSQHKWTFINLMTIAKIDNSGYTITELQDQIECSRTQVNRMVDDCLAEGWVIAFEKGKYQATEYVMEVSYEYLHCYIRTLHQSNVVKTGQLYRQFLDTETM